MTLDKRLIDEMESANVFGGNNGETPEQIGTTRHIWEASMNEAGFALGCEVTDREAFDEASFAALVMVCTYL